MTLLNVCLINLHRIRYILPLKHKILERLRHEYLLHFCLKHTREHPPTHTTYTYTHSNVYAPRVYRCCRLLLNLHDDFYTHISTYIMYFYSVISGGSCGWNNVEERRPRGKHSNPINETGRKTIKLPPHVINRTSRHFLCASFRIYILYICIYIYIYIYIYIHTIIITCASPLARKG